MAEVEHGVVRGLVVVFMVFWFFCDVLAWTLILRWQDRLVQLSNDVRVLYTYLPIHGGIR